MEPVSIDNLSILYQSEDFIVVNKHWDVRIDSKMWYEKLTLQSQLKYRFPELADPGTYYGFRFCHQLDFSTSGALCVALNREAAGSVYKCFKNRTVTKAYLALVPLEGKREKGGKQGEKEQERARRERREEEEEEEEKEEAIAQASECGEWRLEGRVRGHIQEVKRTICFAIGKNTTEGLTHMMCIEGTDGCKSPKPCRSELVVLEHGLYSGEPATKVLLQPLTGRTHQLRVHCSAIGHPIVGDFTYSFKKDSAPYRMMLHAYYLCIPTSKELIEVSAPDPFVPSFDRSWVPQHLTHHLDELIQELKDKGIWAGEEEKQEDPSALPSCEVILLTKTQEMEEQQTHCKQWLSEWVLE